MSEVYMAVLIMAVVNFFTRVFPFLFFKKNDLPPSIIFIGKFFPPIIMSILIIYTLKDVNFTQTPYGFKEIIAILSTAFLHVAFKNYLLSIFLGTIIYMSLVQFVSL